MQTRQGNMLQSLQSVPVKSSTDAGKDMSDPARSL